MNNSDRARGCSPLPPELNLLARKRHYEPGRPVWEEPQKQWLTWGRRSKKEGGIPFDEYFPPVHAFVHTPRSTTSPFLPIDPGENHRRIYEQVVKEIGPRWAAGDDVKPILIPTRNALKEKVLALSNAIPTGGLKGVFKVWVAEAEQKMRERPSWSSPDPRLVEGEYTWEGVFLTMVRQEWVRLASGCEPAFPEPLFPEVPSTLFSIFSVSEPFDRAQKRGLRFHAEHISRVVREEQPVIAKWHAYERILHAVLRDEPIPEWEKVRAELKSQQKDERDSKGLITRHSRTWSGKWERRTRAVATRLFNKDPEGKLVRRSEWQDKNPKDLFKAVGKNDPDTSGDTPHNTIRQYFQRKHEAGDLSSWPTDIEGWFELAKEWAEPLPEFMFERTK